MRAEIRRAAVARVGTRCYAGGVDTTLTTPAPAHPGFRLTWPIGIAYFAFVLIACQDAGLSVQLPSMMQQYHVDSAGISAIFLIGAAGYLAAAFASGPLVERLGWRRFLMAGTVALALGAVVLLALPPFPVFLVTQLAFGVGMGSIDAGLNGYMAGQPDSTAALNYLHAAYGAGALLGPLIVGGALARGLPWNSVYGLWLAGALVALVAFGIRFADTRPGEAEERRGNVLTGALGLPIVWLAALFFFLNVGTESGLSSWSYSYLTLERGGGALLSAGSVSGYWLGLTLGRLVMGRVAGRLGTQRAIALALGGAAVGVAILWVAPNGLVAAAGLLLVGFWVGPIFPTGIAYVSARVPARLVPSAIGFVSSLGSVGAAFFPWAVGHLAQAVGLWVLLPSALTLMSAMFLLWLVLARRAVLPGPAALGHHPLTGWQVEEELRAVPGAQSQFRAVRPNDLDVSRLGRRAIVGWGLQFARAVRRGDRNLNHALHRTPIAALHARIQGNALTSLYLIPGVAVAKRLRRRGRKRSRDDHARTRVRRGGRGRQRRGRRGRAGRGGQGHGREHRARQLLHPQHVVELGARRDAAIPGRFGGGGRHGREGGRCCGWRRHRRLDPAAGRQVESERHTVPGHQVNTLPVRAHDLHPVVHMMPLCVHGGQGPFLPGCHVQAGVVVPAIRAVVVVAGAATHDNQAGGHGPAVPLPSIARTQADARAVDQLGVPAVAAKKGLAGGRTLAPLEEPAGALRPADVVIAARRRRHGWVGRVGPQQVGDGRRRRRR